MKERDRSATCKFLGKFLGKFLWIFGWIFFVCFTAFANARAENLCGSTSGFCPLDPDAPIKKSKICKKYPGWRLNLCAPTDIEPDKNTDSDSVSQEVANFCRSTPEFCPFDLDALKKSNICKKHPGWRLTLCAPTDLELDKKNAVLDSVLQESLLAKKQIPQAVLTAGKAVFEICVPSRFHKWIWNCTGGSGFFLFDNRTFITNHHVLEGFLLKDDILNWDEVIFRDHTGKEAHFRIKGVKFLSMMHDIAVLDVEGYEGPVLKPAEELPFGKRFYIAGYPGDSFKIHPVRNLFDMDAIHYGAFREIFDCSYGTDFSGSSGGPALNQVGDVVAVFAGSLNSSSQCPLQILKKTDFLSPRKVQQIQAFSVKDLETLRISDIAAFSKNAADGDETARFMYFYEKVDRFRFNDKIRYLDSEDLLREAFNLGHATAEFQSLNKVLSEESGPEQKLFVDSLLSEDRDLLSATYFELAFFFYKRRNNLQTACELWKKSGELGHPYIIDSNVVILTGKGDIVFCPTPTDLYDDTHQN